MGEEHGPPTIVPDLPIPLEILFLMDALGADPVTSLELMQRCLRRGGTAAGGQCRGPTAVIKLLLVALEVFPI